MSKQPKEQRTSFNPSDDCEFEVRLVAIHGIPGTSEKEEGIVWRFGVSAGQVGDLRISYPL